MGLACARRLAAMVDALLLVDLDEAAATKAAVDLVSAGHAAAVEPFVLDVTDRDGLAGLAARVGELGTLRAVAHAAGISPSMAGWRRILSRGPHRHRAARRGAPPAGRRRDGDGVLRLDGAAAGGSEPDPAVAAILDDPLDERLPDRLRDALGPAIEDSGQAYAWAKRGVHRFVRQEAIRLGPAGAGSAPCLPASSTRPRGSRRRRPTR